MTARRIFRIVAPVVVAAVAAAGLIVGYRALFRPTTVSAVFTSTTAIYAGDEVRVSGVKVGRVAAIEPQGTTATLTMEIDHDVRIPADAQAIIVAPGLVSDRYVQLTPPYRSSGPTLDDGAVIPIERTAVPVEWDEVKTQLTRLATDLGPDGDLSSSSAGRFVDSAANAMAANGEKLRETLSELSGVGRILADGSGDIAGTIANLQKFVTVLKDSNVEIVQFEDRLATLSSVLDDSRSDLDSALTSLSVAVGDVQRFVSANTGKTSEQVQRLANVTQNLVDNRKDLEQLLHIFPTSLANFYNIYNPETGTEAGVFVVNNFSNPVQFICASIASLENTTSAESARKCADYLGPVLNLLNFNYLPVPINPVKGPSVGPEHLIYTESDLIPAVVSTQAPARPVQGIQDLLFPAGRPPS
ncbi:MCE family protein [Rhodococcus gannanensis]|uniref:MCE family protein n=1 Tax=Rhodococcus gannanensis TaxID=1960308 RepID=A0ABW4NZ34_9NOCA